MAAASAIRLSVSHTKVASTHATSKLKNCQDAASEGQSPGIPTTAAKVLAETVLTALKQPLRVELATNLREQQGNTQAVIKAYVDIDSNSTSWPPRKFTLFVEPAAGEVDGTKSLMSDTGFEVSSSISADQLAEIIAVSSNSSASSSSRSGQEDSTVPGSDTSSVNAADSRSNGYAASCSSTPAAIQSKLTLKGIDSLAQIESDGSRGLLQLRCLEQWHGNTCGHHSIFNVACLLAGDLEKLQDPHAFWRSTLDNIQRLADYGESSGRWPPSRVTKGVADGAHLRHLVESSDLLSGRVCLVDSLEYLRNQLKNPDSEVSLAVASFNKQPSGAHGFLLGATNHWYAAVAVKAPISEDCNSPIETRLLFCDSYNAPLVLLRDEEDVENRAGELAKRRREWFVQKLKKMPDWEHRPEEHFETALVEGVPEWWKGTRKSAVFWQSQPLDVWMYYKKQELNDVRCYLNILNEALGLSGGTKL